MSKAAAHIALAKSLYDCLGRMDFDGMAACLTEDVEAWFPFRPSMDPPQPSFGRDIIIARLKDTVPRMASRIDFYYDHFYPGEDPDILTMEFHSKGELVGGRGPYENIYVTILRFRDGKIALWKEYYDYLRGSGGLDRLEKSAIKRHEQATRA